MRIEIKPKHYFGIGFGLVMITLNFIFFFNFIPPIGPKIWYFSPIIVLALLAGSIFFITDFLNENKRQKELGTKFLEFVRALVESVRSGMTIPKSILTVSSANYGSLTPYVRKLAHQIEWGIPLHDCLTIFAKETKNDVIERSVAIMIQAEKSGGDMGSVLQAVTESVYEVKKVKEEQKSNAYTQMIQSYIIFFVFVAIMIGLQIFLVPQLTKIGGEIAGTLGGTVGGALGGGEAGTLNLSAIFLATIVVQGLFAGLLAGKFSEGDYKSGLKHSLIMMLGGYLLITTAAGLAGASLVLFIPKKIFEKWKKKD